MEEKILLEKNRSKYSVNTVNFLNLDLSGKSRVLPFNDITSTLSLNQLYMDERDNCSKFRMIFTVNPICSNVLFNSKTEVMRHEGSSACTVLFENITGDAGKSVNSSRLDLKQAIRDTEYTHPELFEDKVPYVYHCGFDIFNNHMLRSDDFVYINKLKENTKFDKFNTIEDFVRDNNGKNVQEDVSPGHSAQTKSDIHVYQYDTILSMYDAFVNRLKEKNGWYGFNNTTNISIPNVTIKDGNKTKEISVNKIMNNNKACEIIDLYPDRSLYSFIPKVNKFKRRLEKNWDYCITYPYKKEKEFLNKICGIDNKISDLNGGCSIKIIEAKRVYSSSGNNLVRMKTLFKHNLSVGDCVTLYYGEGLTKINRRIKVVGIGDYQGKNEQSYFLINYNDISSRFGIDETIDEETNKPKDIIIDSNENTVQFFYKKNIDGVDCEYYFRRFAKISKNNDGKTDLVSDVNKLAFGENIYGDRIAQVVFTDDIDVTGLVDHRGKPLTEVYFTIIKRNAGHELWYEDDIYSDDRIEFSHCFGEVTTGIELPEEEYDYNIRKLHNVEIKDIENYEDVFSTDLIYKDNKKPEPVEKDITIENAYLRDNEGTIADIVEYNPITDTEVVLNIVNHRFNTAQRETLNKKYANIYYDDIVADDYDYVTNNDSSKTGESRIKGFTLSSYTINESVYVNLEDGSTDIIKVPGNINLEGYFYNPYTEIKIREVSDEVSKVRGKVIKIDKDSVIKSQVLVNGETYDSISFNTIINNKLIKNDTLCLYNNETKELQWGIIYNVSGINVTLIVESSEDFIAENYTVVSTEEGVPTYATFLPSSHSFVWRRIIPMSELENNSELLNMPFSNGRHYINKNVTFYLKRQDPLGENGLLKFDKTADYKNRLNSYRIEGWNPIDLSGIEYNLGKLGEICY